jgi:hypothetical protein
LYRSANTTTKAVSRILVYRNEYLNSLKGLTNHRYADVLIRVMSQAQLFVSRIDFTDLKTAQRVLEAHNAFCDPADDVKLKLPEE